RIIRPEPSLGILGADVVIADLFPDLALDFNTRLFAGPECQDGILGRGRVDAGRVALTVAPTAQPAIRVFDARADQPLHVLANQLEIDGTRSFRPLRIKTGLDQGHGLQRSDINLVR